jgi:hypothetical protein
MLNFIDNSPQSVHVVGMRGGFQCFNSTSGRDDQKGTIFIDLDARTEILAYSAHNLHLSKSVRKDLHLTSSRCCVSLENKISPREPRRLSR